MGVEASHHRGSHWPEPFPCFSDSVSGTLTVMERNFSRADVRELKDWGLKQVTIGAVVGLSQARVSQILSQGP